ncbi:MAG TPA: Hsp20/alpha crystallin family protein [Kofleriaceae bacterium]|nr:Hsp20/alpha crystallin family protein [Kofleriaceae bacterium]
MQTYYWTPWSIFDELERTFFDNRSSSEWPAFDIEDDQDATTLSADLPGLTEDDLEVTVTGHTLVVRGERKAKDGNFVRRHRWHGAFERQFRLAEGYDLDDVKAGITNGVLTIRLAKMAKLKPRRIKLTSGVVDRVKGLLSGDKDKDSKAA